MFPVNTDSLLELGGWLKIFPKAQDTLQSKNRKCHERSFFPLSDGLIYIRRAIKIVSQYLYIKKNAQL